MKSSKDPTQEREPWRRIRSRSASRETASAPRSRPARRTTKAGRYSFVEAGNSLRSATESVAEAIEAIGWRLRNVSHISSFLMTMGRPFGYYVFRRI